jgi:APA family basic amino acid/polyamine antiporter
LIRFYLDKSKIPLFAREATGLVREFTHLDLFVQAVSICNVALDVVFLLETVGVFYPGANLFWIIPIGLLVALGIVVVWSMMSAAMPRSGGDYVWISRIIPNTPSLGFMYAVTYGLAYAILFNMGFQVWLFANGMLAPTFAGLGVIYNNAALLGLGNWMVGGNGLFVTGLILTALAIITVSTGLRRSTKIINYLFFFNVLATIIYIVLGFAFSRAAFQGAFDSQFGAGQYANILKLGAQAGFTGYTSDVSTTLLIGFSLGYFSLYSNFQYPVWASGEVKRVHRVWVPYTIGMLFLAGFYFLLISALFNLMGGDWLGAVGVAYSSASTAASLPFVVPPTFTFFLTVMFRDNPILVFLINAGLIAGVMAWFVVPYILFSRLIFSMSFDRVLPKAFADITERGRLPLNALLLTCVLVVVWFSQYCYGLLWNPNYVSFFTVFASVGGVAPAAWTVAALVFAFFPWLNKGLYERSMPIAFRKKIGLPIITWCGIFVAITQALATYEYVTTTPLPTVSALAIVVIMVGSFAGYYVIAAIRKSQGIDLKYIFNEIPPE